MPHSRRAADLARAGEMGPDAWLDRLRQKRAVLDELLAGWNDGRRKSLYCAAAYLLEPEALRRVMETLASQSDLAAARAVFWLGGHADEVREGLEKEHFAGLFRPLARPEDFLPAFADWDNARSDRDREGLMLFKGSRGNRLERLVNAFTESRVAHAV